MTIEQARIFHFYITQPSGKGKEDYAIMGESSKVLPASIRAYKFTYSTTYSHYHLPEFRTVFVVIIHSCHGSDSKHLLTFDDAFGQGVTLTTFPNLKIVLWSSRMWNLYFLCSKAPFHQAFTSWNEHSAVQLMINTAGFSTAVGLFLHTLLSLGGLSRSSSMR